MENPQNCPLCKSDKIHLTSSEPLSGVFSIKCERCGQYKVTEELIMYSTPTERDRGGFLLSGLSRELQEVGDPPPLFKYQDLKEPNKYSYLVPRPTDIEQKAQKLLQRIKQKTETFGARIKLQIDQDYPLAYAKNQEEFIALLGLLGDDEYVDTDIGATFAYIKMTARGFTIFAQKGDDAKSDKGFIAIWFDDSMDESIQAIEGAIREAGYTPVCIKDEHFSERIMDKALGEIRQSKFVVVDLTGNRNSVFFETGFAFGLGKDIIYVYKEGAETDSLEFYVKHYQCYSYKNTAELKEKLMDAISARIIDTPKSLR